MSGWSAQLKDTFHGHGAFVDIKGIGLSSNLKESKLGAWTWISIKPDQSQSLF